MTTVCYGDSLNAVFGDFVTLERVVCTFRLVVLLLFKFNLAGCKKGSAGCFVLFVLIPFFWEQFTIELSYRPFCIEYSVRDIL